MNIVRDVGTERCSWATFRLLLAGLPREARWRAAETEGRTVWSSTDHLLAHTVDALRYLTWLFAVVNFKDAPKKPPKPLERPGIEPTVGDTGLTGPEMIARLREQAARHEAR